MKKTGLIITLLLFQIELIFGEPANHPSKLDLPGITRATNNVYLVENHSSVFNIWHARNIKGSTLVHLDTHDDCRHITQEKFDVLKKLVAEHNYKEIFRFSDIESSFRFQLKPDNFLFDLGNFIYPCMMDGTISRFFWVVPEKTLDDNTRQTLQTHIQAALKLSSLELTQTTDNSFSFSFSNKLVTITTFDALPQIEAGSLLDIDTDFFVFSNALSESHLTQNLVWDPFQVCKSLAERVPSPSIITISSSISGGYLPVVFRFISDGCFEYFASGVYPEDANELLKTVMAMISSPTFMPTPEKPRQQIFQPAYEHLAGLAHILKGEDDTAIACMEKAAGLQPCYSKSMLDLADAFTSMGKPKRAHEMIDRFEKFTGCETSQSAAMRIRIYLAEREFDKADVLSQKLVAWDKTPYFLLFRGGLLVEQNKLNEAMKIYQETKILHPNSSAVYYNIGVVLAKQNRIDEAIEYYKSALKFKQDFAMAHENLGYLLTNQGKYSEATGHLQTAVTLNPFNVTSLNNLGLALARQGRFPDAINYYNTALLLNPERPEIHANLAAALISSGKTAEGIEQCKKALKLKPDWPEVVNLMNEARKKEKSF